MDNEFNLNESLDELLYIVRTIASMDSGMVKFKLMEKAERIVDLIKVNVAIEQAE